MSLYQDLLNMMKDPSHVRPRQTPTPHNGDPAQEPDIGARAIVAVDPASPDGDFTAIAFTTFQPPADYSPASNITITPKSALARPGTVGPTSATALMMQARSQGRLRKAHAADLALFHAMNAAMIGPTEENTAPDPMPIEAVEVGEIVAWRAWEVEDDRLYSLFQDTHWRPDRTLVAHTIGPVKGQGIHAFKTLDQVAHEYGRTPTVTHRQLTAGASRTIDAAMIAMIGGSNEVARYHGAKIIYGEVYLWGEVYEFEHGYHAEFARIKSLVWSSHFNKVERDDIAELHQIHGEPHVEHRA